MSSRSEQREQSYWACARVQPQREGFATEHLQARGFEIFLPLVETRKTIQPLFRGYAFVLVAEGRWVAIDRTFGGRHHALRRFSGGL